MCSTNIMYKHKRASNIMDKFILIGILFVLMYILTNSTYESIIFISVRNILAIIFIFFLSGYALVSIIFQEEKLEFPEFLTHCIGLSICISILGAMIIHFSGMRVNFVNVVNIISITTMILAVLNFLRIRRFKKYW